MSKKKKNEEIVKNKDDSLFKKTLSLLNPEEGRAVFDTLTTVRNKPIVGISTGSLGLDYVICPKAGGMVSGHCIELYGAYSTGKSTLALGLCANVTTNKKQVIYVDAERSFSWQMALNAGIDENYFTLSQHRDARLVANNIETLIKTGEVGAVVIDSIPFWKPLLELKKGNDDVDITKSQMAFQAAFITNTLPILAQAASDHGVILILINQERKKLDGYGGGSVAYGCEAQKHINSVRLRLSGNAKYKDNKIMDSDGTLVGQYVDVVADKNKISGPMRETRVPLFFGRGVNPYMEVAALAVKEGVITNSAGWIKLQGSDTNIVKGLDNFAQKLFDDEELYLNIRGLVIDRLGIQYSSDISNINSFHDEKYKKRENIISSSISNKVEESIRETLQNE